MEERMGVAGKDSEGPNVRCDQEHREFSAREGCWQRQRQNGRAAPPETVRAQIIKAICHAAKERLDREIERVVTHFFTHLLGQ